MENNFTINDLSQIKQIIEVACARGAFKAEEMTVIGSLYDKLSNFLNNMIVQSEVESVKGDTND